jgi:hypothetical protein
MGTQGYVETPVSLEDMQEDTVVEEVITPEDNTAE